MRKSKFKAKLFSLVLISMATFATQSYADFNYTVKSGDTLYKISTAYSSTVTGIKTMNNLTTDNLYINQKLVIPTSKFTEYTIVSGDTLWKIAQKFGITITDIQNYNPSLNINYLVVGTKIVVPVTTTTTTPTPAPTYRTYTVVAGDTLWGVATKFDVTIDGIKSLNGITGDYLTIGQVLKIPASPVYTMDPIVASKLAIFPLKAGTYQTLTNNYAAARDYGGTRTHEGQDIMANTGTPVYSMVSGVITNIGWNDYGGYRIMIKIDGINYSLYYAHFSKYATGLYAGKRVAVGELVGYVGSTGYGPEGTSGQFPPHLHVGIYKSDMTTINPYPYLKNLQ